jgi:magnesium-transporting ATPase (P-type)
MVNFLLYTLALFSAPFISGFLSLILLTIFARIIGLLKRKRKEKLLNITFSIISFCSTFLTIIFLDKLLSIFKLGINWLFIIALIILVSINGIARIRKTTNQDRLFEINETIADIAGILASYLALILLI